METYLARALQAAHSARSLRADGDFNAASNRAYYATYYAIRGLFELTGKDDFGKTHASVLRAFSQDFVLTGKAPRELGRALAIVQNLRSKADYSVEGASQEDAEAALSAMESLLAFALPQLNNRTEPSP
ncbi:MAG TPA: HEPN domain-containing protein [Bauldia sp.]|nr:HEPN domain-containing protein [Bauldia sp.]